MRRENTNVTSSHLMQREITIDISNYIQLLNNYVNLEQTVKFDLVTLNLTITSH